jgi:hypothetical protein
MLQFKLTHPAERCWLGWPATAGGSGSARPSLARDAGRAPCKAAAPSARVARPDGRSSRRPRIRSLYRRQSSVRSAKSAIAPTGNRPVANQPFGGCARSPSGRVSRWPQPALFAQYSQVRQVSTENAGAKAKNPVGSTLFSTPMAVRPGAVLAPLIYDGAKSRQ